MTKIKFSITVAVPNVEDFAKDFPHYRKRAEDVGRDFFERVMRPETFIEAKALTKLGLPAVSGVAPDISRMANGRLSNTDRQYVGALIRTLMRVNGFEKTGFKRSVLHQGWTRGEVYRAPSVASA